MSNPQNEKRVLYVSNISKFADENALQSRFSQYGRVVSLNLVDRERTKIAFVEYESQDAAAFALYHLNNAEIHGQNVKVNYARERQDKLDKKKNPPTEQTTDENKPKTEGDTTVPKEKIPTVIERPDTPVGGAMKTSGKNSPSQKTKQKVIVKEVTSPKVESPTVNRNDTTKANTNQNKDTKNKDTTTQNTDKSSNVTEDKKTTEQTKVDTNDNKNQNTTQNTAQNNTTEPPKTKGKKGKKANQTATQNANTNTVTSTKTEDTKNPTYFEIIVRNTQDKSETIVGRITSKGPVIDDKASYERYVAVLNN